MTGQHSFFQVIGIAGGDENKVDMNVYAFKNDTGMNVMFACNLSLRCTYFFLTGWYPLKHLAKNIPPLPR